MRGQKPAAHITIPCLSLLHADSGGSHGGLRSPRLSFSPVSKICTNLYKSWVSARSPFASAESWGFLLGLMWIRRASALLRGIRCPRRFAAPRMLLRAGSAPSSIIILGSNQNSVFAQDASVAEEATENDQGQGKLDEAEKFFQAALDEATKGFGAKDPHVASSCNNLAELYRVKKAYEKAEPLYLEAINILEDTFGAVDVRVGAALHNLGQFYLALRKLEQARKCYERALKVLHLQGKEKEAEDLIRESIRILEIPLNSNRLAEAENFQRKILHILELSKGWDSIDTVIAAENLALTLQSLGNLIEAKELLERIVKDILGSSGMNQNSFKSSNSEGEKDRHVALIIQETFEYPIEVEHALRDCISIFKEPCTRSMVLDARTVKKEYLSCLKHLRNLATTTMEESQKSIVLQELIDEAQRIEAELLPRRH
ncbi:Kinesin light chain [Musa troglodytarum]|uniref:Kinesin light chain n=1 Tax=Musa troglodytarum TaxID=320322 RepID=A0A9E7GYI8_9LILI|nr:Kinesin light chain [Musa troglodytarum]